MSRQYPIYAKVHAPDYSGSKDYGAREYTETEFRVGTSKSNSEILGTVAVSRAVIQASDGAWLQFTLSIAANDGVLTPMHRKYMRVKDKFWQDCKPE